MTITSAFRFLYFLNSNYHLLQYLRKCMTFLMSGSKSLFSSVVICFLSNVLNSHINLKWRSNIHWTVGNTLKIKDRANWSRDTFQPMRRFACVYQQRNQNIAPVIKNFQNGGRSRTELGIVSRLSGIFLRLFMRHT